MDNEYGLDVQCVGLIHEEQGVLKVTACPKWSQGVFTSRTLAPQKALLNIKNKSKQFKFFFFGPCYRVCGGYLLGSMILKREKKNDLRHLKIIMFMPIGIPFLENSHGILCFVSIPPNTIRRFFMLCLHTSKYIKKNLGSL